MGNLSLQLIATIPANLAYGSWGLFAFGLSGHSHQVALQARVLPKILWETRRLCT